MPAITNLMDRLINRSLIIIGEEKFISLIKEGELPNKSKVTPALLSCTIAITSMCDESTNMSYPKTLYVRLFNSLAECCEPLVNELETINNVKDLILSIKATFNKDDTKILLDYINRLNSSTWREEFKINEVLAKQIEAISEWQLFLIKVIVIIKALMMSWLSEMMLYALECMKIVALNPPYLNFEKKDQS